MKLRYRLTAFLLAAGHFSNTAVYEVCAAKRGRRAWQRADERRQ